MLPLGLCLTPCWRLFIPWCLRWICGTIATGICRSAEQPAHGKDLSDNSACRSGVQWTTLQGRGNGKQGQLCQTPVTSCGCSAQCAVHTAEPLQQQLDAAWSMQSPGRLNLECLKMPWDGTKPWWVYEAPK